MNSFNQIIENKIRNIVEENRNAHYWIYPFGEGGRITKSVLNVDCGIVEAGIIDDRIGKRIPERVMDLQRAAGCVKDGVILLTSYRIDIHDELIENIRRYLPNIDYIDVFEDYFDIKDDRSSNTIEDLIGLEKNKKRIIQEEIVKATKKIEEGNLDKYMCYCPVKTNSKFYLPFVAMDVIQRTIFLTDDYFESETLRFVFNEYLGGTIGKYCSGGIFIDAGANIGNHTLYFANELHAKKIYSYEPMKETFDILKKNISINSIEDIVELYQYGLGATEGSASYISYNYANIGATTLQFKKNENDDISITTIDHTFFEKHIKVHFIKIDVEQMEIPVLEGSIRTIDRDKPIVMIETFCNYEWVKQFFSQWNYQDVSLGPNDYLFYPKEIL